MKAFEKRTGCPVIVNTSFNVRGEPIVNARRTRTTASSTPRWTSSSSGLRPPQGGAAQARSVRAEAVPPTIRARLMAIKIYDEINKNPSAKELVKFGATFLIGMGVIGLVYQFYFHKEPIAHGLWIAGGVVFLLSLIPPIGRLLYIFWMGLGITMGLITSPIILVVVFLLLLITPVGLFFKLDRARRHETQARAVAPLRTGKSTKRTKIPRRT
jgi:hypothetical protein